MTRSNRFVSACLFLALAAFSVPAAGAAGFASAPPRLYEVSSGNVTPLVSGDGSTVVGSSFRGVFRWTVTNTGVGGTPIPIPSNTRVTGISGDGRTIAGFAGSDALLWSQAEGIIPIGVEGDGGHRVWGISGDGRSAVGSIGPIAGGGTPYRWTRDDGFTLLNPSGRRGNATAATADGTTIVGTTLSPSQEAFRWTEESGFELLGGISSQTTDVSGDGGTIVGQSNFRPALWRASGELVYLEGSSTAGLSGRANAVSADGRTVVGYRELGGAPGSRAFIWTEETGVESLSTVLTQVYGIDLAGLDLGDVTSISEDGMVLAGWGRRGSNVVSWVAVIPEPGIATLLGVGLAILGSGRRSLSPAR